MRYRYGGNCNIIQLLKEYQKEKAKVGKIIRKRKRKRGRKAEKETDREQNAGKEKDLGIALGYRIPVPRLTL